MEKEELDDSDDNVFEEEKSLSENTRDFFRLGSVKKIAKTGADILDAFYPFFDKPTVLNAVRATFILGRIVADEFEIYAEEYFSNENWTMPYSEDFSKLIVKALSGISYKIIKTSEKTHSIRIINYEGIKIGYIQNSRGGSVGGIFVETMQVEVAKEKIRNLLWNLYGQSNLVMRCNRKSMLSLSESRIIFEVDDVFEPMPSKRAEEYSAYLGKCMEANVSRSVMLYGPPGTGKSTMARTIVDSLKLRSFRIRVEDVGAFESSTIFEAINIFAPDAIILDDFDRSTNQPMLLEILEFFQHRVKLVVATVNNRNSLDEAILRPGRFDELLQIKQMDEEVIRSILGEYSQDAFDTVKDWPIAFVQEYVKRRKFMSAKEAEDSTRELAHRVKRLEKYDQEDDPAAAMFKFLEKKGKKTKSSVLDDLLKR